MHYRTRYRLHTLPSLIISACLSVLTVLLVVPAAGEQLHGAAPQLPVITMGFTMVLPVAFLVWWACSYAEVQRGVLRIRSLRSKQSVDLRRLAGVEVFAKKGGNSKRAMFELILRLEDEDGRELWLPLNTWREENVLMARVLRATVERKVRIDGDPMLVRRFSGLLDSYKSWDRQQAAA